MTVHGLASCRKDLVINQYTDVDSREVSTNIAQRVGGWVGGWGEHGGINIKQNKHVLRASKEGGMYFMV